ncbi:3-dehydroquinate synthase [Weissella uvarum]|uniref:3-dehydroquinate synthase n=1 Tax=Weissella uvarum TaxID=1479233 RepID=UPI001961DC32|nr:3-dehydroquinate synthase [Weissella uvarum]MBM7617171.1 3-dehydroquinate synthase [Weissella uvarum]MCM0595467.1 3-dehydroquinate synthase [Weissella uvarum]
MIEVNTKNHPYQVDLEFGGSNQVGQKVAQVWSPRQIVVISDMNVAELYLKPVVKQLRDAGFTVSTAVVAAGEDSKNLDLVQTIIKQMSNDHFTRYDGVIGLGGGVITDLAGVVASLYMRGISLIQIPTSMTAQVDASVGGKTAVNLGEVKNVIGTFYQPDYVLVDPALLTSLDDRDLVEGYAESIKMSLLAGGDFATLTGQVNSVDDLKNKVVPIIEASIQYKRDVVVEDEYDEGRRQVLNFGHTFGHAIELMAHGELRHGEAVAIGMVAITDRLTRDGYTQAGVSDEIINRLLPVGLPVFSEYIGEGDFFDLVLRDKKRSDDRINFIGLAKVGEPIIVKKDVRKLEAFVKGY